MTPARQTDAPSNFWEFAFKAASTKGGSFGTGVVVTVVAGLAVWLVVGKPMLDNDKEGRASNLAIAKVLEQALAKLDRQSEQLASATKSAEMAAQYSREAVSTAMRLRAEANP